MTDPPPCILEYEFSTLPAPLQASPASQAAPGTVQVWVSAPAGRTIYCSQFILAVPVGTDPGTFATGTPAVTPNTTAWVVSSSKLGTDPDLGLTDTTYAIFTIDETSADSWDVDYQLAFSMQTGAMSTYADTFPFVVVETSAYDSPDDRIQRKTIYTLEKTPARLYLDNLVAVSPSTAQSTLPRTAFGNGEEIELEWESNGSAFAVYAGDATDPVWTGADTSCLLPAGLTVDTAFTVVATLAGTEGSASLTIALTVTDPTLVAASVGAGTVTATTATVTGEAQLATAHVDGTLTVAQAATLAGVGTPAASLDAATLASATVTGGLDGNGGTSVSGVTSVSSLSVGSWLAAFAPRPVGAGVTYSATSDGLVVGSIKTPDQMDNASAARISGTCSWTGTVYAEGGITEYAVDDKDWYWWGNPNTFVLPVPAGSTFWVGVTQKYGTLAAVAFWWVPFARNATLTEVGPAEAAGEVEVHTRPDVRAEVARVLAAFAPLAGDRLTPALRERLTTALLDLTARRAPAAVSS
jgi:hypothetical protein